jgi:hypothetical protein
MKQTERSLQEYRTTLPASEVLAQAKRFFARRNGIYAAFLDREGPNFVTFRGQGTEEIVIATSPAEGGTLVTGSTYLFDMQVARFFSTLPPFELTERLAASTRPAAEAPRTR